MTPYHFSKGTIMSHLIKFLLASTLCSFGIALLLQTYEEYVHDTTPYE